ncbi:formylglycine-generating enzyme family protein [Acinetobacter pollinis]|uniref:SUMF1/EgtB/PvdO family nonheme iron enzyme n=1 Tax=Acinetobacter pollinis TaxID=2605270 RepID=A0ABU6DQD5_9GAMM|nr:SUMF1/EgtB/PvdO family nonheme iron enzyme [Acinetobacter pollinis]MEB5475613.1 SUMF1/EgtB/PvdO family nonheme iron enzyme [Acinetobacter pollinis]
MIQKKLALLLLSGIALSGCVQSGMATDTAGVPTTKTNLSNEQKQQLQQLIEKTKKNLIFVKGGSYMMGDFGPEQSPERMRYDGNGDSKPLHKVTLDDFSLSATKATYADFDVYTSVTGQKPVGVFDDITKRYRIPTIAAGINWQQARSYCQWLGKQIHRNMDLPTEAQWEYAARNRGQYVLYATDNGKIDVGRNVWSFEQREKSQEKFRVYKDVAELQQFPPSPLGFYDMVTDNFEWMLDWYDADYYRKSPEHNPQGPSTGTLKVVRSMVPDEGKNMTMFGNSLAIRRSAMHPVADPEKVKWASTLDFAVDLNENNSVRCAANP